MARWEPGTAERMQQAALELFATRGFEQTTAAEIAAAVGLTERTFFRHFSDKREVLFHGQDQLLSCFLDGVAAAPADAPPMRVVEHALRSSADYFPDERRPRSRARQAVVDAVPALRERERHKLATIAEAIAAALRGRGVPEPAATLAAESGMTVFAIAFTRWLHEDERRSFAQVADWVLDELVGLTAGR
ncbi:TetR family transcriptional regulator [Actinokineospora bangkokensis]|uniref:TetR family transcriptional regulator n=1 Tax=Actinokineospora bangkokensis TaxID=1193682 RepID=A0A1Q9LNM4_9PSEU|nr:TetR family transcriptional regulator [Actinokineospora bangkokensis]OLR93657.1 TetR family transcriptional regulator [Actinokineospora bangkokensis]